MLPTGDTLDRDGSETSICYAEVFEDGTSDSKRRNICRAKWECLFLFPAASGCETEAIFRKFISNHTNEIAQECAACSYFCEARDESWMRLLCTLGT